MSDEADGAEDSSFPWPQKGDQLIKADNDWWLNACVDWWNKDFGIYADGYKKAADLLVDCIIASASRTRNPIDYLIFPIVFLYRQYIELKLKEIIRFGIKLHDFEYGLPTHHKLDQLWTLARGILNKESASQADLTVVGSCIAELVAVDPLSQAFRYPVDKQGKDSVVQEQVMINVRHLKEIMAKMASFLDAGSECMLVKLQQRAEIENYYRQW